MALERDETIQELVDLLRDNLDNARIILERIEALAGDRPEPDIMHIHDIKVIIYLYALNAADFPSLILAAIETIVETPGFYWTRKYADQIRENVEARLREYLKSPQNDD